jgi:hypothetical protein
VGVIWNDQEVDTLKALLLEEPNKNSSYYATVLTEKYKRPFTDSSVRGKIKQKNLRPQTNPSGEIHNFKDSIDINSDGTHTSNRLVRMSLEESKDVDFLLKAHGYSKDAWELISARSNVWNAYSKKDGIMQLYSSKISVKPRANAFNIDVLIEAIKSMSPAVVFKESAVRTPPREYINIPLFDMHFGNSSYEYYQDTQERLMELLSNKYKGVLFIIGQDMFHNDNFRGTTTKGTVIDKVDMHTAWNDALKFYDPLIHKAMSHSDHVHIMYSKGNHDETVSWCFVQMLKSRYPDASFDDLFKERKVHMLGRNFIGVNHGDKQNEKELTENFAVEFPLEFASATNREVYVGHKHSEWVYDRGGVLLRRMPTRNRIDGYHDDNGYTKAHKRFQVLEYSEIQTERIHYL